MADAASLVEAGRRCSESGDWSGALEHLRAAHALGALAADDLDLLAQTLWMLGHVAESVPLAEQAYRRLRADGRRVDAAMTALRLSLLWLTRGDATVGRAWLARAHRLLVDEPDGPAHAYLAYLDASAGMVDGGETWSPAIVERLDELARRFPEPDVESLSLVVTGMAALSQGRTRQGFALLDEAMLPVLAEHVPAEWAGDIYCTTIHMCSELADFRRMEGWTAATERWSARFASTSFYTGICRVHRLELRWALGEWADAEERIARESTDVAHANPFVAGEGFSQLGEMRRMRGDAQGARQAFARAEEFGVDPQPGAALLELHDGDVQAARSSIALALTARSGASRVRLLRAAVEIALADGARDEAAGLAQELRRGAERYDSGGFRAWALHAAGLVALERHDVDTAIVELRDAEAAFRRLRQPYEVARTLALAARALEAAGRHAQAGMAHAQAQEILDRLGAVPTGARADDVAHGGRVGPLTPREAEVLERVALGNSNRDVARYLVISEKTIGRHLANIYLKLGVSSRTAAAAWWHRHAPG